MSVSKTVAIDIKVGQSELLTVDVPFCNKNQTWLKNNHVSLEFEKNLTEVVLC